MSSFPALDSPWPIDRSFGLTRGGCLVWLLLASAFWFSESNAAVRVETTELSKRKEATVGFRRMTSLERELAVTNVLSSAASARNRILENGAGVALGDVDGDGLTDLFVGVLEGENQLFVNQGGMRFKRVENAGGAACVGQYTTGVLLLDTDGDQDLDLVLGSNDRRARLFSNDGLGSFSEVTDPGFLSSSGISSVAAADVDRDGDLDLYVSHYRERTVKDETLKLDLRREDGLWILPEEQQSRFISTRNLNGRGILLEQGLADALYLNDGSGRFSVMDWTLGFFQDEQGEALKEAPLDWTLSASFSDVNRDGYPDLYVCSDFISPDRFWINQSGHGFQAVSRSALSYSSWSSMCVDWSDIDLDGEWDFFVGDMLSRDHQRRHYQRANHTPNAWTDWAFEQRRQYMRNTLFLSRGDESFAEVARLSGLAATEWTWNCFWMDVDRDGLEDLLITNGHPHDSLDSDETRRVGLLTASNPEARLGLPSLNTPNLAFRNRGNLEFDEQGEAWGFNAVTHGQGGALGDLDGDGDQDIVVNPLNSSLEIYENIGSGDLVAIRLREARKGRTIYGANVTLETEGQSQMREIRAGGHYLSSDDTLVDFGVEGGVGPFTLKIVWPDGMVTRSHGIKPNSLLIVSRLEDPLEAAQDSVAIMNSRRSMDSDEPLFEDVSDSLNARHSDEPFDDSALQSMLAQQLSTLAMGIGWIDVDENGWDDVLVGGGNGNRLEVYHNVRGTEWDPSSKSLFPKSQGDQVGLSWWLDGGALVATSGYESVVPSSESRLESMKSNPANAGSRLMSSFSGAMGAFALGDYDLDGDLDVFAGMRHQSGRFPESQSSWLLNNGSGGLVRDGLGSEVFRDLGMVSGVLFCHLNDDAWIDLVVSLDWGRVEIYLNREGEFVNETDAMGLSRLKGLWQSVDCGDFNGDGRFDLILGNWGRNRNPKPNLEHPLRLYYGELIDSGEMLHMEAYFDEELRAYVPVLDRDHLAESIPLIHSRYPSYRSYGAERIETIVAPYLVEVNFHEVDTLDSLLLMNLPEGFDVRVLPVSVQLAPVFGISVADLNGDAHEDLFLSQNFYGTELSMSPFDAGSGVCLLGDGLGGFVAESPSVSGLSLRGASRASALSDFNRDGRWDLLVGRRARQTALFLNRRAEIGIRVALVGSEENPRAIGARLRLRSEGESGAARIILGGGGDGAQDTLQPLLYCHGSADELWVKWPDGHETLTGLPDRLRSIIVDETGEILEMMR